MVSPCRKPWMKLLRLAWFSHKEAVPSSKLMLWPLPIWFCSHSTPPLEMCQAPVPVTAITSLTIPPAALMVPELTSAGVMLGTGPEKSRRPLLAMIWPWLVKVSAEIHALLVPVLITVTSGAIVRFQYPLIGLYAESSRALFMNAGPSPTRWMSTPVSVCVPGR